ncbi:hypothetical protein M2171_005958 [Bradyrhizobium japonicum USDA 38]|nr:hypothetical protein [Bradyrhizobium japonicum]MCS3896825.1 hypothetical protein [Bradyrhizobium japonicum USDA 38]MCS3949340.1 hypothetical protein [Bradyrhizobium japonicum]MCW2217973.1 hypothetical protein [Bradyrhizobium japonicum]
MSAIVEEQEGHAADQIALATERQDALRIEREISRKLCRSDLHTRHQPVRHFGKRSNFGRLRTSDIDVRTERQSIEIMPCGKGAPFHTHVTPLSFEDLVPRYDDELSGWGSGVCSSYCTGVLL